MNTEPKYYKGGLIYKNAKNSSYKYSVQIEDGMFTYSILEAQVNTVKEAKDWINRYYTKIGSLYK